jgi:hypothetical protein
LRQFSARWKHCVSTSCANAAKSPEGRADTRVGGSLGAVVIGAGKTFDNKIVTGRLEIRVMRPYYLALTGEEC